MTFRLVAIFLLMCAVGCTTIVRSPATPVQPVLVYLTDEGIHSSVLMPVGEGWYVEYALGDWDYAALIKHDLFHTMQALCFSPQGAMGRRLLKLNIHASPMSPELRDVTLHTIVVEEAMLKSTEALLGSEFAAGQSPTQNPENHYLFVKVPEGYGLFHNCNSLTKRTLRALGCRVTVRSLFAMYEVQRDH